MRIANTNENCKQQRRNNIMRKLQTRMKIAKGTLKSHHVCVIHDSKYVTNGVKCYNSGSLYIRAQYETVSRT